MQIEKNYRELLIVYVCTVMMPKGNDIPTICAVIIAIVIKHLSTVIRTIGGSIEQIDSLQYL